MLVGNKKDLADDGHRLIEMTEGAKFALDNGKLSHYSQL